MSTAPELNAMPANARWCQPGDMQGERRYLVRFDDPDCNDAVFTDWDKARTFYAKATLSWNCWLFAAVPADAIASPVPQGEAEPASHGVVTAAMIGAAWYTGKRLGMIGGPSNFKKVLEAALAALAPALAEPQGVEKPIMSMMRDTGKPAWQQINDLFVGNGINAFPIRLRDELVVILEWARYGEAIAAAPEQEKSNG